MIGPSSSVGEQPVQVQPPQALLERLLLAPGERLGVEVAEILEASRGEEALAHEADRPLDATLLVAACQRHGARLEAIPGGKLQQRRVEADGIADALQDCALEVVIEDGAGRRAEVAEGRDVPVQEAAHRGVQVEARNRWRE
jgi:hypothetical protein